MREIKFRAWDCKEMQLAFDLSQNPKYWWEENKDYPLMQYTGLKDKNGVEIYEGDILNLSLMDWCHIPLDQFVVSSNEFHNDICYISAILKGAENDWAEVIGNIYKHPHLLEVKS